MPRLSSVVFIIMTVLFAASCVIPSWKAFPPAQQEQWDSLTMVTIIIMAIIAIYRVVSD